jgi:hypothetical protein
MEVRADIRTLSAAGLASEPGLQIGQPYIVGPLVGADLDRVAAPIVGAIDQQPANAGLPHFAEGNLLSAHGLPIIAPIGLMVKRG